MKIPAFVLDLFRPVIRTRPIYIILSGAFVHGCLIFVVQWHPSFIVPFLTGLYLALFLNDGVKSLIAAPLVAGICALLFGTMEWTREGLVIQRITLFLWLIQVFSGALGALLGSLPLGFGERWGRERFFSAVFLLGLIVLLLHGASVRGARMSRYLDDSPVPQQYRFDASIYLRAFYLLERDPGAGYYACMVRAINEDARGTQVTFPQNVRLPTIFVLWSLLLPSFGSAIWQLYLLFAALSIWIAFKALRQLGAWQRAMGLLGAVALVPHFFFIATERYILFPEAWAVFPSLAAIWFYATKKRERAALAGMGAALVRETFGFVCLAGFCSSLVNRKWKRAGVYGISILLLLGLYALHVRALKPYLPPESTFKQSLGEWAHLPEEGESPAGYVKRLSGYFHSASSFGMGFYPFGQRGDLRSLGDQPIPWNHAPVRYLLLGMALLGIWKMRNAQNRWFSLGLVLLPILLVVMAAPHPRWGEYWGILFMPLAVILSPLALRKRGPGFTPKQLPHPTLPRSTGRGLRRSHNNSHGETK